jgi:diguanylate cyclase (GGDEF)-like protein/PAS domain S-box-containing protein
MTPIETSTSVLEILKSAGSHPVVRGFPEGAIVVFDRDLRYLCAGGEGLALVGLTRFDYEGRTIYEVFPRAVASVLEQPFRDALAGKEVSLDVFYAGRTYFHRIAPLRDDDQQIVAGIGFVLDVTAARDAERALRESETMVRDERRRLRDAEDIGHSGSWEWDLASDVITWSDGLFVLHGIERESFPDGYAQAASRVDPADRELVDAAMDACRRGESSFFRYRVTRVIDGQTRWFASRASGIVEDGVVTRLVGAVADVTDQVSAEEEVTAANKFLQAVMTASPDYTFISNIQTGVLVYGSRDRDLLGVSNSSTELVGHNLKRLVHPDDVAAWEAMNDASRDLKDGEVLQIRYRLRHADGRWHWMTRHAVPFRRDASGKVVEVLGVLRDVTDVVNTWEGQLQDALHDELTGLPSRSLVLDRIEEALARTGRDGRAIAVLYCDLDGFKRVNDAAGHAAGDAVLVEAAARFRGALRDGDTVARMGGDEFVLIVEPWNRSSPDAHRARDGTDARALGKEVATRVLRAMSEPFVVDDVEFDVTVSIGVTHASCVGWDATRGEQAGDVIREADGAMYESKRRGGNQSRVFGDAEPAA